MAYWREYHNKFGALTNRSLVYTAKDRRIQKTRIETPRNMVYARCYVAAIRKQSMKSLWLSSDPLDRLSLAIEELERDLEKMRVCLAVTRAIIAGKKPFSYSRIDRYGRSITFHLSGHIPTIKSAIYDLEYRLKYHIWLKNTLNQI